MSDLLGSILNSMDAPPSFSTERSKMLQKQKKLLEKQQAQEKAKLLNFREKIQKKINEFNNSKEKKYKFQPMENVYRTIIHDVADIAGLSAFAFGEDGIDRYVMIFKKEYAPSDDELSAYRNGEEYDPDKAKAVAIEKEKQKLQEIEESKKRKHEVLPSSNYKDKYEKLLGREAGKDAARVTTSNKQFGLVPSEQKKDQRSIEQTLADIKAKKKQKIENESNAQQNDDVSQRTNCT